MFKQSETTRTASFTYIKFNQFVLEHLEALEVDKFYKQIRGILFGDMEKHFKNDILIILKLFYKQKCLITPFLFPVFLGHAIAI